MRDVGSYEKQNEICKKKALKTLYEEIVSVTNNKSLTFLIKFW